MFYEQEINFENGGNTQFSEIFICVASKIKISENKVLSIISKLISVHKMI